jgi:chemotaxis protein MotB
VDKILAERGTLSKALDDAKSRLDELRKAQAVAEARLQLFRDFAARFKHLVDAGEARVDTRRGRLVIELKDELLFDGGRADLRSAGKGMLMEVARALQTAPAGASDRQFLVITHGDDLEVPRAATPARGQKVDKTDKAHFKTTWELTAARAVTVVEFLVTSGVSPSMLTAGAAGSFDPLPGANAADAGPHHRGLELTLLAPDDLPPGAPSAPAAAPSTASPPALPVR